MADVAEYKGETLDEALRPGVARCAALIHPDPQVNRAAVASLPQVLQGEDRGVLFELSWVLGCMEEPDYDSALQNPRSLAAERRCQALARGGDMLASWPQCLQTLLVRSAEADETGAATRRIVDRLRVVIRRPSGHGRASALLDEALKGIRWNSFSTLVGEALGQMTAVGFCRAAGLKRTQIRKLRLAGAVRHMAFREGRRALALYSEATVNDVRERVRNRTSAAGFARHIGISQDGVFDLAGERLLRTDGDAVVQCLWPELHIVPDSARALADDLCSAIPVAAPDPLMTRVNLALRAYRGPDKPWVAIVKAILDGSLRLLRRPGDKFNLRACYVHFESLPRICSMPVVRGDVPGWTKSDWLNEADARERLACDGRGLRFLLKSEKLNSSGRFDGATFARSDVDELALRLMHSTELGIKLGYQSTNGLSYWLKRTGLEPDTGGFFIPQEICRTVGLAV